MLARLALVTAVTFAVATAALWPYRQLRVEEGFQRPLDGIASLSASGWSYLATTSQVHYPLWSHHIFGQRTQEVLFPGFTALGLCLVALAVRSTALAAGRRRMFVAIGAIGFVMSLGTATPVYAWAYHLFPPMQGIRAAGRFGYLVLFAVAGLAGIGLATLRRRWPARRARLVSIALLGLVTLEAFHAPLRYARFKGISAIYRLIAQDPDPVAVVDVPVFEGDSIYLNATYMLASTEHWKPLLNGYSGSTPQSFKAIAAFMATFPSGESIARLRRLGVRYVVVHLEAFRERDRAIRVVSELLRHPEIELLAVEGGDRLYRIRGVTPRAAGRD